MRINYLEYFPSADLKKFIECFWTMKTVDSTAPVPEHRVLPDGCMDFIFDFSSDCIGTRTYFVGTMTTPAIFTLPGYVDLIGVRFNPGCALPFIQTSASECVDEVIELAQIWDQNISIIWEQLQRTENSITRIEFIQKKLRETLTDESEIDPYVQYSINAISKSNGKIMSKDLEIRTGIGQRQLERKFARHLGLSPKAFSRIIRFKSVVKAANATNKPDWADIAINHGYTDQSHLIKDFREFSGLSPSEFIAAKK